MSGRPKDPFEVWASDLNYPAGANGWNGTPTRVRPSSGEIADGFAPDASPPAQWWNYAVGRACDFVDYLERIEVVNWRSPVFLPDPWRRRIWAIDSIGDQPFALAPGASPAHVASNGVIRVGGMDDALSMFAVSRDGGTEWEVEFFGAGKGCQLFAGDASFADAVAVSLPASGASTDRWFEARIASAAWSSHLAVSSKLFRSLSWVEREDSFLVTGKDTTSVVGWIARVNLANPPTLTAATITSARADPIHLQAHNDDISVVLDQSGWGWTATNTVTTWTPTGHVIPGFPLGLVWWETAGVFLATTDTKVYTSEDGALWSEVFEETGTAEFSGRVACLGGICLAERGDSNYFFVMSVDGGVTWERAAICPVQDRALASFGADLVAGSSLVAMNGRFVHVACTEFASGVGKGAVSQSLRVRP